MPESQRNEKIDLVLAHQEAIEKKLEEYNRSLYGDPATGYEGLQSDVKQLKKAIETMIKDQQLQAAEKRGMKRLIGYTGITSAATLITLLLMIWQAGVFGGG